MEAKVAVAKLLPLRKGQSKTKAKPEKVEHRDKETDPVTPCDAWIKLCLKFNLVISIK